MEQRTDGQAWAWIVLAVLAGTAWIGANEFLRNEILFKSLWVDHFASLGLVFPSAMINNALWGLWSLLFASVVLVVTRRFSVAESIPLAWVFGFLMMWVVVGNLGGLPLRILPIAVPWSLVEVSGAVLIVRAVAAHHAPRIRQTKA